MTSDARLRTRLTAAGLLLAAAATLHGQRAPVQPQAAQAAPLAGWRTDFNFDGTLDFCQIVTSPGFTGLTCTVSGMRDPIKSGYLDLGYPEGRAWVDFDGDRKPDYCRVVGNGSSRTSVTCTLSEGRSFGATLTSPALDAGYPDTRYWRDANSDGKADFCRVIGTNRDQLSCTFSQGRTQPFFGRTVNTKR